MKDLSARQKSRGVWKLVVAVVAMFGFGYLLIPLYDVFCDLTGLRFTAKSEQTAPLGITEDTSRSLWVEFDTTLNAGMPWKFEPEVRRIEVHPGRMYTTHYIAKNNTGHAMIGRAVPSITPLVANKHFVKTECFCFSNQEFEPGEQKSMPVIFMVHPNLPKDVKVVTLSYTFFDVTEFSSTHQDRSDKKLLL